MSGNLTAAATVVAAAATKGTTLDEATAQAYEEALDDVHTRFILNLPPEELATSDRIFFQLEQAFWFYDDFHCDTHNNNKEEEMNTKTIVLPRFKHLQPFARKLFQMSPILQPMLPSFNTMWDEFSAYKRKISTFGTILLNASCTKVILCQDWSGRSWTFPAGKVNQNERGTEAGARETYEETGFDPNCNFGRTRLMKLEAMRKFRNDIKSTTNEEASTSLPWSTLKEKDRLVYVETNKFGEFFKRRTCYVCWGVPEDFPFCPVARKEVSAVEWHEISELPKNSFAVLPFLSQLKRWIRNNHPKVIDEVSTTNNEDNRNSKRNRSASAPPKNSNLVADMTTVLSPGTPAALYKKRSTSTNKKRPSSRSKNRHNNNSNNLNPTSRPKVQNENDMLISSGLASLGDEAGWTEEDMFRTNEMLLGRKINYDGNPHAFSIKGFDDVGVDPHLFRVVGGQFMNASRQQVGIELGAIGRIDPLSTTSNDTNKSKLHPLFGSRGNDVNDDDNADGDNGTVSRELKPFFSDRGVSPWGDVIAEVLAEKTSVADAGRGESKDCGGIGGRSTRMECFANFSKGAGIATESVAAPFDFCLGRPSPPRGASPSQIIPKSSNATGLTLLNRLRGENQVDVNCTASRMAKMCFPSPEEPRSSGVDVFLTDAEITARSQEEKAGRTSAVGPNKDNVLKLRLRSVRNDEGSGATSIAMNITEYVESNVSAENDDLGYLKAWVSNLPKAPPTKDFGFFRFDVNAIMKAMRAHE